MSNNRLLSSLPSGLLRRLLRLPIVLYRLHLGWMLGGRFVLLNHIGRKSGKLRQTVVEVVGYNRPQDTYYIVSGWGHQSDWYQNLQATPNITIQVGRRKVKVHAETVPAEDGASILLDYRQQHPLAARELSQVLGLDLGSQEPDVIEKVVRESLPVVALQHHA